MDRRRVFPFVVNEDLSVMGDKERHNFRQERSACRRTELPLDG